ncbi:hypothetical protein ABW19_dt0207289 [Dactylella cylindrospora]|nr:hypothetical protein ABW19_dt0207289 [Dactylella cylindrospora]
MATNPTTKGPLSLYSTGGDGGGGFSTSGQIDWVTLGGSSVKFTVDVLSRLSKAGIEALTLAASYAIFGQFRISSEGELRVQKSVEKLHPYSTLNNALFLGFGVRHVIRDLAASSEGLAAIAICASLSEFYDSDNAALILRELFNMLNPPSHLKPSLRQWLNLVQSCEGALAYSNFSLHVSHLTNLYTAQIQLGAPLQILIGDRGQIASALYELGSVAAGKVDEVVFFGGADCCYVAAIASWLFGLVIEVRIYETNELLFRASPQSQNSPTTRESQVTIFFHSQIQGNSLRDITQVARYHHIPGGDHIFRRKDQSFANSIYVRLQWSTALRDALGGNLDEILTGQFAGTSGKLLGLLVAASSAESGDVATFPNDLTADGYGHWRYISTISRGERLLEFIWQRFPEVQNTAFFEEATAAYRGHRLNPTVLMREFLQILNTLWNHCLCDEHSGASGAPETPLLCVAEFPKFLFNLARGLSYCRVDDNILPTKSGLNRVYANNYPDGLKLKVNNSGVCHVVLRQHKNYPWILLRNEQGIKSSILQEFFNFTDTPPLALAMVVFSGYWNSKSWVPTVSAYVERGLCFVEQNLLGLTDDPEEVGLIHVFPGAIEFENDCFSTVIDDSERSSGISNWGPAERGASRDSQPRRPPSGYNYQTSTLASPTIQMIVRDNSIGTAGNNGQPHNSLWVRYRLQIGGRVLNILPAEFTRIILANTISIAECTPLCSSGVTAPIPFEYQQISLPKLFEVLGTIRSSQAPPKKFLDGSPQQNSEMAWKDSDPFELPLVVAGLEETLSRIAALKLCGKAFRANPYELFWQGQLCAKHAHSSLVSRSDAIKIIIMR